MTRIWRHSGLLLLVTGALVLASCSEGDRINLLSPGAGCLRPQDPLWRQESSLTDGRSPQWVDWPEGGQALVVGSKGLILERSLAGDWVSLESDVSVQLETAATLPDGRAVAAGRYGATGKGHDGIWRSIPELSAFRWERSLAGQDEVWLAGQDGALAVVQPGLGATLVTVPTEVDLNSLWSNRDSLFVGGDDGFFGVLVGEVWHEPATPLPDSLDVKSVVGLEDGRLLVQAQGFIFNGSYMDTRAFLYLRDASGWSTLPAFDDRYIRSPHRYRDGYLWEDANPLTRWDTTTEPWTPVSFETGALYGRYGVGPGGEVLVAQGQGWLAYRTLDDSGGLEWRVDHQSTLETRELFRLGDESVVFPTEGNLYRVTPQGPILVPGLSAEVRLMMDAGTRISGASLDDFLFAESSQLLRCRDGNLGAEVAVPEDMDEVRGFVVADDGKMIIHDSNHLAFFDGESWDVMEDNSFDSTTFVKTNQGTLVAMIPSAAFFLGPEGPVLVDLESTCRHVWESEPGVLIFFTTDFHRFRYEMGTGILEPYSGGPHPQCPELRLYDGGGANPIPVFATREHSMVVLYDPLEGPDTWDLVAGPWRARIGYLQVLQDGSLVGVDTDNSRLVFHPGHGY